MTSAPATTLRFSVDFADDFKAKRDDLRKLLEEAAQSADQVVKDAIGGFLHSVGRNIIQADRFSAGGAGHIVIRIGFSPVFERLVSALRASRDNGFSHIDLSLVSCAPLTVAEQGAGVESAPVQYEDRK